MPAATQAGRSERVRHQLTFPTWVVQNFAEDSRTHAGNHGDARKLPLKARSTVGIRARLVSLAGLLRWRGLRACGMAVRQARLAPSVDLFHGFEGDVVEIIANAVDVFHNDALCAGLEVEDHLLAIAGGAEMIPVETRAAIATGAGESAFAEVLIIDKDASFGTTEITVADE